MSKYRIKVRHRFGNLFINLAEIDAQNQEDTYAFGGVREIFIRDCYFRHHPSLQPTSLKTIVDLGGNIGLFSTLCSSFAQKIVTVEVQQKYVPIIAQNLHSNDFTNFTIVNKFIGTEGLFIERADEFISFRDLLTQCKIEVIDFLKIDIEGSEFTLFQEDLPLEKIRYISMEIHPHFGDVKHILHILQERNFSITTTTSTFEEVSNSAQIDFLYARNQAYD